jgi:hypothetical protein
LIGNFVKHMREYVGSTQKFEWALHVTRKGRQSDNPEDRDILPDSIGLDVHGNGQRWNLLRFSDEGRDAAVAAGKTNPQPRDVLVHGLHAAARRAPFLPGQDRILGLMRMALFSLGPSTREPQEEHLAYVAKQMRSVVREYVDDSTEQFNRWAEDRRADTIHRISKRRDCPLDREGVRQALLELGMQWIIAYGECVDAAMEAFEAALPEPLSPEERDLFQTSYRKDKRFGNLPLVLLLERFDFCRPAIIAIWNDPCDREAIGVFYRTIAYFAEMLDKRRSADRRRSRLRGENCQVVSLSCAPEASTKEHGNDTDNNRGKRKADDRDGYGRRDAPPASSEVLKNIVQDEVERRLGCDLECLEWNVQVIGQSNDEVTLLVSCPELEISRKLAFSKIYLTQIASDS